MWVLWGSAAGRGVTASGSLLSAAVSIFVMSPFPCAQGTDFLCGPGPCSWNLISKRKRGDHGGSGTNRSLGGLKSHSPAPSLY